MSDNNIYFHISNGGVTFSVEDEGMGPKITMSSSHFGHETGKTSVMITEVGLTELAEFFTRQATRTFTDPYCCVARTLNEEGPRCNSSRENSEG